MTHLPKKCQIETLELQLSYMSSAIQANYLMNAAIAERIWNGRRELAAMKARKADADFAYYLRKGWFPA